MPQPQPCRWHHSRFRRNDGCCSTTAMSMASFPLPAPRFREDRLRGNDSTGVQAVIPAQAGIHRLSPSAHVRASHASSATVLAVIPAQAGIHRLSPSAHVRASDTSIATVLAVIPAQAGIHRLSPSAHVRASDASSATILAVIPAQAGIHRLSPSAHVRASDASSATILAVIPAQAGIHRLSPSAHVRASPERLPGVSHACPRTRRQRRTRARFRAGVNRGRRVRRCRQARPGDGRETAR